MSSHFLFFKFISVTIASSTGLKSMLFFYKEYDPENIRVNHHHYYPVKSERDMVTIHQKLTRRKGIIQFCLRKKALLLPVSSLRNLNLILMELMFK